MHSPTLFSLAALLLGTVGLVMVAVWRFNPGLPGMKHWARAYGFGFVFCVSFFLQADAPGPWAVLSAQGGMLMMAHQCMRGCFVYVGRGQYAKRHARWAVGVLLVLAMWFTLVTPHLPARMLLGSVGPALFYVMAACVMMQAPMARYPSRHVFAWVCGGHGLFLLVRPALMNFQAVHFDVLTSIILVESILAVTLLGFCLLMLVNEHATDALRQLAETDSLTGVFNHRMFRLTMSKSMSAAQRHQTGLAVALMDLDRFKAINDTWGHQVGDEVLRQFVLTCQTTLRHSDVLGRLGGEEFALLLPNTSYPEALSVVERLREQVAAHALPTDKGRVSLSVSVGLTMSCGNEAGEAVLSRADQAMYRAKHLGRNRVEVLLGEGRGTELKDAASEVG